MVVSRRTRAIRAALSARESDVTKSIREYCERLGFPLMRGDPGGGRARSHNAGMPDYLAVLPGGQLLAIEAKRPDAPSRENAPRRLKQAETVAHLRAQGACVIIARSVEDVAKVVNVASLGMLRDAWTSGRPGRLESPPEAAPVRPRRSVARPSIGQQDIFDAARNTETPASRSRAG